MADTRYLKRRVGRRRSGTRWYARVPVPKDLRGRFGKIDAIERCLHTGDLREAQRRRHAVVADVLAMFDRARAEPTLDGVLPIVRRAELARAHSAWSARIADRGAAAAGELLGMLDEDDPHWKRRARRALLQHGLAPGVVEVEQTAEALLDAHTDGAMLALNGRSLPLIGAPSSSGLKASKAGEQYLAERTRDPKAALSKQTAAQNDATFRLFADFTDDAPLNAVTRRDVAGFLDTLAKLHRHYGRRRGASELPLAKLLVTYPAADGEGLSNKTLNRHLSALSSLYRWARRRGHVPEDRPNPFSEQMREAGDNPYLPFTVAELNALFKDLAFQVRPKRHTLGAARPWIMAVALYSGMREAEICDLDAENVRERAGVAYFDVTAAKSEAGVRLIPVHSRLAALGFLDYVAAIGQGPLFPGVTPGGPDRKRAHTFAKRFPAFRRKRGATRPRTAFHSFRKNFVRALELAKVDRDRAALVVGHERGFTFRVYNPEGLDVVILQEVLEAVSYDGLELPAPL